MVLYAKPTILVGILVMMLYKKEVHEGPSMNRISDTFALLVLTTVCQSQDNNENVLSCIEFNNSLLRW